jgi:hypothetical protein
MPQVVITLRKHPHPWTNSREVRFPVETDHCVLITCFLLKWDYAVCQHYDRTSLRDVGIYISGQRKEKTLCIMEHEGSLLCSQQLPTGHYPKPLECNEFFDTIFLEDQF